MNKVIVKATVVRNNGEKAVLKPHDDKGKIVKMYRGAESRREFFQMFPLGGEVHLTRIPVSAELEDHFNKLAEKGGMHDLSEVEDIIRRSEN